MAFYFVAQFRVSDHSRFRLYETAIESVLPRFGGEVIVSSNDLTLFAGQPNVNHIAITRFPDEASARKFTESAEYQMTSVLREAGADMMAVLVRDQAVSRESAPPSDQESPVPLFRPDGSAA